MTFFSTKVLTTLFTLTLFVLFVQFTSSLIEASSSSTTKTHTQITVSFYEGLNCGSNGRTPYKTFNVSSNKCYIDKASGKLFKFSCKKIRDARCIEGSGYYSQNCYTYSSRQSTMCNSCTGDTLTLCNEFTASIKVFEGCTRCENCTSQYFVPYDKCVESPYYKKNQSQGSAYAKLSRPVGCKTLLLTHHYQGECGDMIGTSGITSGFCSASSNQKSRTMTCHGEGEGDESDDNVKVNSELKLFSNSNEEIDLNF